jgi:hypothetical protein
MAQKANLKGAKSAGDSFNRLYNKIVAGKFGGDDATASTPAKGSPLKRKGVAESGGVDDGDDDEDQVDSPVKKAKGKKGTATPRKGKAKGKGKDQVKADVDAEDDVKEADEDGDNIVVKAEVFGGAGEEA